MKTEQVMRNIHVEKVTLNMGAGGPGDKLDKAVKLLARISNMKPLITKTKKRIPTWGIRPGLEIGCKVTLRGNQADELLRRLFAALDNKLPQSKFDTSGNVSFGITEYLHIPKVEYDSTIGIVGLEVAVTLRRNGYRVARRTLRPAPIPKAHQITKEEAIKFIEDAYKVQIV